MNAVEGGWWWVKRAQHISHNSQFSRGFLQDEKGYLCLTYHAILFEGRIEKHLTLKNQITWENRVWFVKKATITCKAFTLKDIPKKLPHGTNSEKRENTNSSALFSGQEGLFTISQLRQLSFISNICLLLTIDEKLNLSNRLRGFVCNSPDFYQIRSNVDCRKICFWHDCSNMNEGFYDV